MQLMKSIIRKFKTNDKTMYNTDSYKYPFWAENSGFMTGRDALGIQNSSITTYSRLLPGLTNLTLRLRYYGFYCWLLSIYDLKSKNEKANDLKGHYNFIRRAELIVAFIMRKLEPHELSIIGSNFTSEFESDLDHNGFYDIHLGADKNKNTIKGSVYWDFDSGALGQYYSGALTSLNLIETAGQFFIIQPEGKKLAIAFAASLTDLQCEKFLQVIDSGKLTENDIDNLGEFAINNIIPSSAEWKYYKDMLLKNDGIEILDNTGNPTSLRRETIALFLNDLQYKHEDNNERSFIARQYELNLESAHNEASFGWYYYYVNEAFHFALETIFWSVLVHLDGKEQFFDVFIQGMTKSVVSRSVDKFVVSPDQKVSKVLLNIKECDLIKELHELESKVKSPANNKEAIVMAFHLIFVLFKINENRINEILAFETKYKITDQKGRVSENIKNYVQNNLEIRFDNYIKESIQMVLNDHINTAFRKMGNGESNLLKFIIEEGIISHIQTMNPRHTSPRLRTITNFMQDLSMIDKDKNLTELGQELLQAI